MLGDLASAKEHAKTMKGLFGEDYYREIQNHGIAEEQTVREALRELSAELDIPLVATNDVHYPTRADAQTQAILMCIQTGTQLADGRPGQEQFCPQFDDLCRKGICACCGSADRKSGTACRSKKRTSGKNRRKI
jgi:DNA polymerase III alpha subunit